MVRVEYAKKVDTQSGSIHYYYNPRVIILLLVPNTTVVRQYNGFTSITINTLLFVLRGGFYYYRSYE